MTRKHFQALANMVMGAKLLGYDEKTIAWFEKELADFCAGTNSNFDYGRFYTACEPKA